MAAYYNEFDHRAVAWLRELIKNGLIEDGDVDERNIKDVQPADIAGYAQCHFFAGIGGWSLALRMAEWDRPVWTGSPPCQPFSANGRNKGTEDHRDLWPVFFRLIRDCRPATIFGEQSPRAIAFGWLDRLSDDLEEIDYAIGSAVLPAASVRPPHERLRLFWLADSEYGRLAVRRGASPVVSTVERCQRIPRSFASCLPFKTGTLVDAGTAAAIESWEDQPERISVVDGISAGVGSGGVTRGYGNAIVPKVAAEFIRAFMETE